MTDASAPSERTPHDPDGQAASQQTRIVIPPDVAMVQLLGPQDQLMRTIERAFPRLFVFARGNELTIDGPREDAAIVETLVGELLTMIDAGHQINRDAVERSIGMLRGKNAQRPADVLTTNIISSRGRTIRPKTLGQKEYVDAIDRNTIVFGIGPAGTGKTYLAMAKAVAALQAKQVNRIILTRPAVEAGERLGFLPGTLNDKIDPYLRPLYDALHDMIDPESIPRLMAAGTIEAASMLPYLAAIGMLTTTPLDGVGRAGVLLVYCLVMVAPALGLLLLRLDVEPGAVRRRMPELVERLQERLPAAAAPDPPAERVARRRRPRPGAAPGRVTLRRAGCPAARRPGKS